MNIHELPNPLHVEIREAGFGVSRDLTGIPAESLILTMVDMDNKTYKEIRGKGTFRILDPFMGRISYKFSEEDLALPPGSYDLYVGRDDGVAGPAEQYEVEI